MKLSIHQVFEALSEAGCRLLAGPDIVLDLTGVRLLSAGYNTMRSDILYILDAAQLCVLPPNSALHFLCIGDVPEDTARQFQSVLLLPEGTQALVLLSQIQDLFDRYAAWSDLIYEAIIADEPLQAILELAAQFMKNPVALVDSANTRLLASGETCGDVAAFPSFVEAHGHTPAQYLDDDETPDMSCFNKNAPPIYLKLKGQYSGTVLLRASLYVRDVFFGHLAIGNTDAPLTDADYANMLQLRAFMQHALENAPEFRSYISETPQYFAKLLRGEPLKSSVVSFNLLQKKREINDRFFLWCFRPRSSIPAERSIKEFLPSFRRFLQNDMIFCHEDQVLSVDYILHHYDDQEYLAELETFLATVNFDSAYSLVFGSIYDLRSAYEQCRTTLESSDADAPAILSFRQSYRGYLVSVLEANTPYERLLYPGLRELVENNKAYGTELLRCLQIYLASGKNLSATARRMFTHRHTVIYRLEIVSKALGLNLTKIDEDTQLHLIVSCELLHRISRKIGE